MFPIKWNKAFRKKDGSITTMDGAISGGTTPYELPTASSSTKGGVKIGNGLTMTGEVLSADAQVPAHTSTEAGKVLTVGDDGSLEWDENGGAGGGLGFRTDLVAETLTIPTWDTYSGYTIDVSDMQHILIGNSREVSFLPSGYYGYILFSSVNYPPTENDFHSITSISSPSSGHITSDFYDISSYNYLYALSNSAPADQLVFSFFGKLD